MRRKLRHLQDRYAFLETLVGIDSNGTPLVNAVRQVFVEMGFKRINNVDKSTRNEDLQLFTDDKRLLVFEVTGIDGATPTDDKAHRITKHVPVRQSENPDLKVFGVFVVNHDNKNHHDSRHKKPFRKELVNFADKGGYSLTTTKDLLNAFILFKQTKMTPMELIDKLCSKGEIKI